jgi:hypothetical protein
MSVLSTRHTGRSTEFGMTCEEGRGQLGLALKLASRGIPLFDSDGRLRRVVTRDPLVYGTYG